MKFVPNFFLGGSAPCLRNFNTSFGGSENAYLKSKIVTNKIRNKDTWAQNLYKLLSVPKARNTKHPMPPQRNVSNTVYK